MYQKFKVGIHLDTFISHSGQTADPLNQYARAMKEISSRRKKSEADHIALARIEYEAGLYLNADRVPVIPGRVFEAAIAEGAKKSKESKVCLSAVFVDTDALFTYEGGPLTLEQLLDSDHHRLAAVVRVGTSRIVRTRPIFRDVRATFEVSLETDGANPAQLQRWIGDTLGQVGIGDWRPRHGRGSILSFAEQREPLKAAA
jgi:hypothetical protein